MRNLCRLSTRLRRDDVGAQPCPQRTIQTLRAHLRTRLRSVGSCDWKGIHITSFATSVAPYRTDRTLSVIRIGIYRDRGECTNCIRYYLWVAFLLYTRTEVKRIKGTEWAGKYVLLMGERSNICGKRNGFLVIRYNISSQHCSDRFRKNNLHGSTWRHP